MVTAKHGGRTFSATLGIGAAPPEAPRNLHVWGLNGYADFWWLKPEWDGGTPITSYEYRYSVAGEDQWGEWTYLGPAKPWELFRTAEVPLGPGAYVFEIRAVNAVGAGPEAAPATVRVWPVQSQPEGAPTEPLILWVMSVTGAQADLKWGGPAGYGDAPIKGFRVETCLGSSNCDSETGWSVVEDDTGEGGTASSFEWSHALTSVQRAEGLKGRWYRVSAVTETGLESPHSVPARHPGASIDRLNVSNRHTGATVWVNLKNPDGRDLYVRLERGGTHVETQTLTASGRSLGVVFENLEMDTAYTARVDFAATFDSPAAREIGIWTLPEGLTHPEEDPFKAQTVEVSTDDGRSWSASAEITVMPGEAKSYRMRLLPCGGEAHTVLVRQGHAVLGFLGAVPVRQEPANLVLYCNADDPEAPGEAVEVTLRAAALDEYPSAHAALSAMPFRMPFLHTIYTSHPDNIPLYLVAKQVVPVTAVVDSAEGPVQLTVLNAAAHETYHEALEFRLKLDRAADWPVTAAWATRHLGRGFEGAATPGLDYVSSEGRLTFAPGETEKRVSVPIVDDAVEDSGETLRLWVYNVEGAGLPQVPPGYQSVEAVGTIYNSEEDVLPALTAGFAGVPGSHDGQAGFSFELHFSEEFDVSYRAVAAAFEATGGTVTARRLAQGSNLGWRIEVEPATDGTVTVVLAGRACGESGAVCTGDGPAAGEPPRGAGCRSVLDRHAACQRGARGSADRLRHGAGGRDADGVSHRGDGCGWARGRGLRLAVAVGRRGDGAAETEIAGATNPAYTVTASDLGRTLRARVSFTDGGGTEETLTSAATAPVAAAALAEVSIEAAAPAVTEGTAAVFILSRTGDPSEALTVAVAVSESGAMVAGTPPGEAVFDAGSATAALAVETEDDGTEEAASAIGAALVAGDAYTVSASEASASVSVLDNDEAATEEPVAPESGPLAGFTVVDASDQSVVGTLADGGSLPLDDPDNGSYGIRADIEVGQVIGSVRLVLSGGKDVDQTENYAPYSLYGDAGGNLNGESLPAGQYTLTATAYSEPELAGNIRGTLAVSFTVTGPATEEEPNTPAEGQPTISGTVQVGETLTAETTDIKDDDGLSQVTYSYQWIAVDGTTDTEIQGATDETYTLVAADVGKTIKVRVSFTDDAENEESLTSEPTAEVAATVAPESGPLAGFTVVDASDQSVVGTLTHGDALPLDDPDNGSYGIRADLEDQAEIGSVRLELIGAKDVDQTENYAPYSLYGDAGGNLNGESLPAGEYTLTATAYSEPELAGNIRGTLAVSSSVTGPATEEEPNTPAEGQPTISGTVQVGETLTAETTDIKDADGLSQAAYSYQWLADEVEIAGATDNTYTLAATDAGKTVKVKVSFTDDAENEETLTSEATAAVEPKTNTPAEGQPTISGTVQVGETLTAETTDIKDADGLSQAAYSYQWLADEVEIAGATDNTYTLAATDAGKTVKVKVSFTDDAENEETLTSEATAAVEPKTNTPAEGQPTISGTVQVGETLTAETTDIKDADGLSQAAYSYQWLADEVEIAGATDNTYTLAATDAGKTVKVKVSFTDDANNKEALTSEATAAVEPKANSPATGQPTISGTAQVGETLTAETRDIADADGLSQAAYSYQWLADEVEIAGATDNTYTLAATDAGKTVKVKVSFTDDANNKEALTSEATAAVEPKANSPATGQPTISGTAQVGETLTAETRDIADADGLSQAAYSYQWLAGDVEIAGATDSNYTLAATDAGKTVKVKVSFTDDASNKEALTSEATAAVEPKANSPATGQPTISGTAQVGETLTAETRDIADADGLSQAAYSYQWLAGDVEIAGATDSNYTLAATDAGKTVKVQVSFTDDASNKEALTSEATAAVEPKANTPATGQPTISGTAQVGETLTAETTDIEDADGMDNASFSYQWLADDLEIAGATDSTYALVDADEGKTIKVRVSFNDDANNQETLTSEPTAAVAANPDAPSEPPNAPRTVRITGDTISSLTLSWVAPGGGGTVAEYRVQWHAIGEGFARARRDGREAVVNASALTHTITGLSEDEFYMVRVLALNGAGESEGSNLAWGITGAGKSNYGHS